MKHATYLLAVAGAAAAIAAMPLLSGAFIPLLASLTGDAITHHHQHRHHQRGAATPSDWCLPQRITMSFEGTWRGLTLWGQLPSDGPVKGEAVIVQNATDTLCYFRYTTQGGVVQEQWAVWQASGKAITIGKNSTVGAGSEPDHPQGKIDHAERLARATAGSGNGAGPVAVSCTLIEDTPATEDNNPKFCSQTPDIDLRFTRWLPLADGEVEEWTQTDSPKTPNATLRLLMRRLAEAPGRGGPATVTVTTTPVAVAVDGGTGAAKSPGTPASTKLQPHAPASTWTSVPGAGMVLPVYHYFESAAGDYYVDHLMHSARPDVDMSVFAAMPPPASCARAEDGEDSAAELGPAGDVAVRDDSSGGARRRGLHVPSGMGRRGKGGKCPYGFDRADGGGEAQAQGSPPDVLDAQAAYAQESASKWRPAAVWRALGQRITGAARQALPRWGK